MWILFVKIVLGFFSVVSLGLVMGLPQFITYLIIISFHTHILNHAPNGTSFWIMLGLTVTGFSIGGIVALATKIWSKAKND